MSALCMVKRCARANALAVVDSKYAGSHSKAQDRTGLPGPRRVSQKSGIRWSKVAAIREGLADGTYDLNSHLDAVVERLFQALTI